METAILRYCSRAAVAALRCDGAVLLLVLLLLLVARALPSTVL
jgi:hypothetical protein